MVQSSFTISIKPASSATLSSPSGEELANGLTTAARKNARPIPISVTGQRGEGRPLVEDASTPVQSGSISGESKIPLLR